MYSHLATLEYLRSSRRPCLRTLEAVRGSSRRVANFSIQGLFPGTGFFYKKPLCRMLEKGFQRRINREVFCLCWKKWCLGQTAFLPAIGPTSRQVWLTRHHEETRIPSFFFLFHFLILLRVFISFLPSSPTIVPESLFISRRFRFLLCSNFLWKLDWLLLPM